MSRLRAQWYRVLAAEGFDDIEHGRLDGNGPLASPLAEGAVFAPASTEILGECVEESRDVVGAALGIAEVARDMLYHPGAWRGLPRNARRWWALQVLCGWSQDRSARLLRVPCDGRALARLQRWREAIAERMAEHAAGWRWRRVAPGCWVRMRAAT